MNDESQKTSQEPSRLQVDIFPEDYRNEQFDTNMEFFEGFHPGLYQALVDYRPEEYRICLNPDGSPNIININDHRLVYQYDSNEDLLSNIQDGIKSIRTNISIPGDLLNFEERRASKGHYGNINLDPIQRKMRQDVYDAGPFGRDRLVEKEGQFLPTVVSDYIPYLRVYGVGLGLHIQELIRMKNISFISIYEPNIDLFYSSLYVIDWGVIFKYFTIKQRLFSSSEIHINLYLGSSPESVDEKNSSYLKRACRYLVLTQARYAHFATAEKMQQLMKLESKSDTVVINESTNGWYEDQRAGFYNSAKNIKRNYPFYTGGKVKRFLRVFVVGSGPSLDASIEYINKNCGQALVISCGSAFSALLNHGIVPDIQVLQERDWQSGGYEEQYDSQILNKITLIKLNVVSPEVDQFYKETLVFQKYNDPGSSILNTENFPVSTHVNPTVTNAGVTLAAELGANEVYLFGLDYGAFVGAESMHASSSLYNKIDIDDSVEGEFEIAAAFGGVALTSKVFLYSLQVTEGRIDCHPDIKWFNVEDGALIKGAKSVRVGDIYKFSRKMKKIGLMGEVRSCFNSDYDSKKVIEYLRLNAVQEVADYLDMLLEFSKSTPKTREDVLMVAVLMDHAMLQHKVVGGAGVGALHYYPGFLLSGGVQELIFSMFSQTIYANDDQIAAEFFNSVMGALKNYRDDIIEDMRVLISHIVSDEEIEIKLEY